jgi:hypothetical protein
MKRWIEILVMNYTPKWHQIKLLTCSIPPISLKKTKKHVPPIFGSSRDIGKVIVDTKIDIFLKLILLSYVWKM